MSIDTAFRDIVDCCHSLERTFQDVVRWAVTEAAPPDEDHVLVTRYEDAIDDVLGALHSASLAASMGRLSVSGAPNIAARRAALIECQRQVNEVVRKYHWELFSPESVESLSLLAEERGARWSGWSSGVRDALAQCREPLEQLTQLLWRAWVELDNQSLCAPEPAQAGARRSAPEGEVIGVREAKKSK